MQVAIITGAAQGIGRKTAELFAAAGFSLLLVDVRRCEETISALQAFDVQFDEVVGDVSKEETSAQAVTAVERRWGQADVLVNNAGISLIAPVENTASSAFARVLEVNLIGPFLMARAFGDLMLRQKRGSIVNVASIAGLVGIADRSAYNASKHGLIGLTRTLAAEWGGRGVRSNAVCPGWVKTEMDIADQAGGGYCDIDIENVNPMGRFAAPGDIAKAILFLADPDRSGFINDHALTVDGGWTTDGSWESLRLRKR